MTTIDAIMLGLISLVSLLIGRSASRWQATRPVVHTAIFAGVILATVLYAHLLQDRLGWVHFVTAGHSIWWTNLVPIGLALAAGVAVNTPGLHRWHRPGAVTLLSALAAGYLVLPLVGPMLSPVVVAPQSQWKGSVCLQTAEQTCGPAAVATLLRHHRVAFDPATIEWQLTGRCLTTGRGTTPLGIYRGLNESIDSSRLRVMVGPADPADWRDEHFPALVRVRIPAILPPAYRLPLKEPTEGHALVILRRRPDRGDFDVADPAVGATRWPADLLADCLDGRPLYLRRVGQSPVRLANRKRHPLSR